MSTEGHVVHGTPVPPGAVTAARARFRAEHEHDDDVVVIPEPQVRARPAKRSEIPRGAMAIGKLASANGWKVKALYARGPYLDASGQHILSPIAESLVIRGTRGLDAFDASWLHRPDLKDPGWKFDTAWVRRGAEPFAHYDSPTLKILIRGEA